MTAGLADGLGGMAIPKTAFAALREAAQHTQMIADPPADAIAKQFPDKFGR